MPEESIRAAAIRSVEERLALLELRWVPSGENGEPGLRFSEECLRKATRRETAVKQLPKGEPLLPALVTEGFK